MWLRSISHKITAFSAASLLTLISLVTAATPSVGAASNGDKIAYAQNGIIYTASSADGSSVTALYTPAPGLSYGWPTYSPDGTRIAFVADNGSSTSSVYVGPAAGGTPTQITATASQNITGLAWSPDGSTIAFSQAGAINTIASNTTTPTAPTTLYTSGSGSVVFVSPAYSPDGQEIAFIHNDTSANTFAVYKGPAGGGTPAAISTASSTAVTYGLAWSPDGSTLAFAGTNDGVIYTVPSTGTSSTTFTAAFTPAANFSYLRPVYSPDGTRMVFRARDNTNSSSPTYGIYVATVGNSSSVAALTAMASGAIAGVSWQSLQAAPAAAAPGSPNTGLAAMVNQPAMLVTITLAVTASLVIIGRRLQSAA